MCQQGIVEAGEEHGGGGEAGYRGLVHDAASVTEVTVRCVATHCVLLVSTAATAHSTAPLAGCAPAPPAQVQPGSSGSSAQWPDSAPRHQWPL